MYKELLTEAYAKTQESTGIDPRGKKFKRLIADQSAYDVYAEQLANGLSGEDANIFRQLAENTRVQLLENSQYQLNPYETLAAPVLRVFYPKLIAKELVNVVPIDKPEVIRPFLKAYFKKNGETTFSHQFPSTSTDISRGPDIGVTVTAQAYVGETDVLAVASLTSSNSHLEKDFVITKVTDSTGNEATVAIKPDVDGNFSAAVTVAGVASVVSGHVDYLNGTLTWSGTDTDVTTLDYQAYASLEENAINPTVNFTFDKIELRARDRQIQGNYTLQFEQDARQLWNIDVQAELVNVIGEQIALDIDREIVAALISANTTQNAATHTATFDKNPSTSFVLGRKAWYENILQPLSSLSAQIYNSSYLGSGNTLACNPADAAIFENINSYEFLGNSVDGGSLQYKASVGNGKYTVLVSSVVPSGKIIVKYRSQDVMRAVYIYAPYVPAMLHPYPLGNTPSMSILSRYATRLIRPEGLAVLNVTDTA